MPKKKRQQFIEEHKPDYVRYEKPIAITPNHKLYHRYLKDKNIKFVLCDGFAGSGKSLTAIYYACQAYLRGEIKGICITKENIGVGEEIGYVKGTELEKMMFRVRQLIKYIESFTNTDVDTLLANEALQIISVNALQGVDLTGYWLIVDEAQNIKPQAMHCICTRGAEKVVINGDCSPAQCAIRGIKKGKNGLSFLIHYLGNLPITGIVSMDDKADIVRQDYLKDVIPLLTAGIEEWQEK